MSSDTNTELSGFEMLDLKEQILKSALEKKKILPILFCVWVDDKTQTNQLELVSMKAGKQLLTDFAVDSAAFELQRVKVMSKSQFESSGPPPAKMKQIVEISYLNFYWLA